MPKTRPPPDVNAAPDAPPEPDLAGSFAASADAAMMAVRSAAALAPLIVLITEPFLMMRKVGILGMC